MTVNFWNLRKRRNSTGQPPLDNVGFTADCKLKDGCGLLNPVIELSNFNFSDGTTIPSLLTLNYAYIADFHRYYYIKDWQLNGTILTAFLQVDVLASYKSDIRNSTQYVLRAYSNYNGFIRDTKYPVKAGVRTVVAGAYGENPLQPPVIGGSYLNGCFVLGIVNKNADTVTGCVSYYVVSDQELAAFMYSLFSLSTQWGSSGADLADGLKKAITDPMQYIVSCLWLPYTVTDFVNQNYVTSVNTYTVGYDDIAVTYAAYKITAGINVSFTNVVSFTTPVHPLSTSRGAQMDREPFTRYFLSFYPFCDLVELDATRLSSMTYLLYTVDLRSGAGVLNVCSEIYGSSAADWKPAVTIRAFEAQVGQQIPLATIHTEVPNSISQYTTNFISAAASNSGGFGAAISSGLKTIGEKLINMSAGGVLVSPDGITENMANNTPLDYIEVPGAFTDEDIAKIGNDAVAMKSTAECFGSQGTMSLYNRMPLAMWAECFSPVDANDVNAGRPLCQYVSLSGYSGFVMCENPHIAIGGAYSTEIAAIESLMSSGFYIE